MTFQNGTYIAKDESKNFSQKSNFKNLLLHHIVWLQ